MDKKMIRDILESDLKEVVISISEFIQMQEEDEWTYEMLKLLEQALEQIANGVENPQEVAKKTLAIYRGED